eukprot:Mycagemm_TRINITY_DN10043_c0_g4::TRINITY_DN10043_c0_g4_i1::g.2144::m.2144 type:complete len:116 gc:universal TRINITY_DN10043_c0_g4_i1:421-74(-)
MFGVSLSSIWARVAGTPTDALRMGTKKPTLGVGPNTRVLSAAMRGRKDVRVERGWYPPSLKLRLAPSLRRIMGMAFLHPTSGLRKSLNLSSTYCCAEVVNRSGNTCELRPNVGMM